MPRKSPIFMRKGGAGTSNGSSTPKHLLVPSGHTSSVPSASTGSSANHVDEAEETIRDGHANHDFHDESKIDLSSTPDYQRTRAAIEHTYQKVDRTKQLIKEEQTGRDENVNEYLKLAGGADKQQLQRIKSIFEKRNQKSAQSIAQLQKKLETYHKRIRDLETHGVSGSHWQPREVLRDVGQGLKDVGTNIKEGITGFSGGVVGNIKGGLSGLTQATHSAAESVMAKPREFAHLIKNRFGSADNINSMEKATPDSKENQQRNIHGSATFTHNNMKFPSDEESSSFNSGSAPKLGDAISPHQQLIRSPNVMPLVADLEPILQELRDRREEYERLVTDIESLKSQVQQEYSAFTQSLHEERYRYERLEEQMNDLIELHQNEIENLKQGLADVEEKVQYQSEERLRDLYEIIENCQTRISRMEHQQHQHFQQLVSLDSLDGSNARALALKLVNVVLTVLQVVLLLVATVASILMPFIQTRLRILTSALFIMSIIMLCKQWPELLELGRRLMQKHIRS